MILMLMGISGSGKTTIGRLVAERLGWVFHDADDDHTADNIAKMRSGIPLEDEDRTAWITLLRSRIVGWLASGDDVVIACSALRSEHRRALLVDRSRMTLIHLVAPVGVIRIRLQSRAHFFPEHLLESQLQALQQPDDATVVDTSAELESVAQRVVEIVGR